MNGVSFCFHPALKGGVCSPASFLFLEGHKDSYLDRLKKYRISWFGAEQLIINNWVLALLKSCFAHQTTCSRVNCQ